MTRVEFLKGGARNAALLGLIGLGAVLGSRKKKFQCNDQCGRCSKFKDGNCTVGIK